MDTTVSRCRVLTFVSTEQVLVSPSDAVKTDLDSYPALLIFAK